MVSFWQQLPFVRILIPFILGIYVSEKTNLDFLNLLILLAVSLIFILCYQFLNKKFTRDYVFGILISIVFFFLGGCTFLFHHKTSWFNHYSQIKSSYLILKLTENPTKTEKGWKALAIAISARDSFLQNKLCNGKLLVYFNDSVLPQNFSYGSLFAIKSNIQEISSPLNPNVFDYKRYMANKGVYHSIYLKPNFWVNLGSKNGNKLLVQAYALQHFIQATLQQNLKNSDQIGIAEALLYGYDKDISDGLLDSYTRTGTLHVLAVSGMHVGLVFMLLGVFLKPFQKNRKQKAISALIQVLGIWAYSILCGLSPSILRATVMFSFIVLGKQIQRSANPLNGLAASAFLLLLITPTLIYDVGFQLSYSAVLGIMWFYSPLYLMLDLKHRFLDEIWKIISVSIAAQAFTIPFSLYYFHQFPTYFLLANLIIIPISSIIIYLGIVLLLVSKITVVAKYVGLLIGGLISLLNGIAAFIAQIPGSCIEDIYWPVSHFVAYLFILIGLIQFFRTRNIKGLYLVLLVCVFINCLSFYKTWIAKDSFMVYAVRNDFVFHVEHKGKAYVYHQLDSLNFSKVLKNTIKPNLMAKNLLQDFEKKSIDGTQYITLKNGLNLYVLNSNQLPKNCKIDLLIMGKKQAHILPSVIQNNKVNKVLLGMNIGSYERKKVKSLLIAHQIPFYDISENGAFELSL